MGVGKTAQWLAGSLYFHIISFESYSCKGMNFYVVPITKTRKIESILSIRVLKRSLVFSERDFLHSEILFTFFIISAPLKALQFNDFQFL